MNCPDLLDQFLAYHASRSRKRSPSVSKRRRSTTQPAASQSTKSVVAEALTEKTASNRISAPEPKRVRKEAPTKPLSTKSTVASDKKKSSADKAIQPKDTTAATTVKTASSTQKQQQQQQSSLPPTLQSQTDVTRPSQHKSTKHSSSMKNEKTIIQQSTSQPSTKLPSSSSSSSNKGDIMSANETAKSQPISTIEPKHPQQASSKTSIYMNTTRPKTPTPPVSPTPQKTQLPSSRPINQSSNTAAALSQKSSVTSSTPAKVSRYPSLPKYVSFTHLEYPIETFTKRKLSYTRRKDWIYQALQSISS